MVTISAYKSSVRVVWQHLVIRGLGSVRGVGMQTIYLTIQDVDES